MDKGMESNLYLNVNSHQIGVSILGKNINPPKKISKSKSVLFRIIKDTK